MKHFQKITLLLLAAILLPACNFPVLSGSGGASLDRYNLAVESWRGANIDELLAAWPRQWLKDRTVLEDGSTGYAFIRREEFFRQAEQYYDHSHNEWVDKTPAGTELLICETRFIADPQGLITDIKPGNYQCGQIAPPPSRPR